MSDKKRPAKPLYETIVEKIENGIVSGEYPKGHILASEPELAEQFGVSRYTIREALKTLQMAGVVSRRKGLGTVVNDRREEGPFVQQISDMEELLQYPEDTTLLVLSSKTVHVDDEIAELIGCEPGSEWLHISCIRRRESEFLPICWTDIYALPLLADLVGQYGQPPSALYEAMDEKYGLRVATVEVQMRAGTIMQRIAEVLNEEPGSPSLDITRRYLDEKRGIIQVAISHHPADRFQYDLTFSRG